MSMDVREYGVICPNCGRNIFEGIVNGKCMYCDAEIEDEEDDIIEGIL